MDSHSTTPDVKMAQMPGLLRVLIVEDTPSDADLMLWHLRREGYQLEWQRVENEADYLNALESQYDLILSDWSLPQFNGLRALQILNGRGLDWPFIIVSGGIGEETAVAVMHQGAADYVLKDRMGRLGQAVKNALEQKRLKEEYRKAAEALSASEAELRGLFASMTDVVLVLDREGVYRKIAPTHPEMLVKPGEDLLGKNLSDVFPEQQAEEYTRTIQKVLDTQQVSYIEYELSIQNRPLWFDASVSPISQNEVVWMAREVSQRKQAAEMLRASEERFRSLYENATIGMYRTSPDGRILIANPSIVRMFGYDTLEDLLQRNLEQEGFQQSYLRSDFLQQIEAQGEIRGLESAWKRSDGTTIFVRESARTIRDADGKALYYEGTVEDITERKQAEIALERHNRTLIFLHEIAVAIGGELDLSSLLHKIMAHAEDLLDADRGGGIYLYEQEIHALRLVEGSGINKDRVGIIVEVNEGVAGRVFRTSHSLIVNNYSQWEEHATILVSSPPSAVMSVPLLIQGQVIGALNVISNSQQRLFTPQDLQLAEMFAAQAAISIQNAKLYEATQRQISERMQAEETLRLSEARYRNLIETQSDIIARSDLAGNLTFANDAYCRTFGKACAELLGNPFTFTVFPEDLPISLNTLDEIKKPPYRKRTETRHITTQGICYFSWDNSAVLDADGNVIEFQGVGRDITERKQAELDRARQSEELSRLYRATGALLTDSPYDIDALAETILRTVLDDFGQTNCSLFLVKEGSKELIRLAAGGVYSALVNKMELTLDGPGLVPLAIRAGNSINVPDVRANPSYIPGWEMARSELAIPLKIADRVIGVIDVQSAQLNAFSEDDERLMTIFADRAALALEHARLNRQTEQRMQNLSALRTIDMAIASSFEIHLTLDILLDQVVKLLGVHAADVLIYNPITQTLRFSAGQGFHTQLLQHADLHFGDGSAWQVIRQRQVVVEDLTRGKREHSRSRDLVQDGFLTYIGVPLIAKGQIKGVLEIFQSEPLKLDPDQSAFLDMLGSQAAIAIDNAQLFENLQGSNAELMMAYDETIEGWSHAMDLRDKETEGHSQRVTALTVRLAASFGLTSDELLQIRRGALLHDIGKLGVPDEILRKTGPLSDAEWVLMRKHPQYAYDMLAPITYLHSALDIPYCHHEKWDGSGYPRALKKNEIPLGARIFAVVDVWDALTSKRPYRDAWPREKALNFILEQSGKHFDPRVVGVFLQIVNDIQ